MPAKSEAQRRLLNARFGHAWVKGHHFDNRGKLPAKAGKKGRAMKKGYGGLMKAAKGKAAKGGKKLPFAAAAAHAKKCGGRKS